MCRPVGRGPGRMSARLPVTIEFASATPDRVRADLLAVPVFAGSAATGPQDRARKGRARARDSPRTRRRSRRPGLGRHAARVHRRGRIRGQAGDVLAVPTAGQLGAKAAVLVGMGDPDTLDADAIRRAGAALARRASKVEKVATTLLDAVPDTLDRAEAAQAFAEGRCAGCVPVPHVQIGCEADAPRARASARAREREGEGRVGAGRAHRAGGRVGATS